MRFFRSIKSTDLEKEMKRLEKERRLEIVRKESFVWKERREKRALEKVAEDWLMEECLGVAIYQAEVTISKVCTRIVEEVIQTALRVGEKNGNLKTRKRNERIATGRRKREELLDELARRKRRELAALRSLEARLGAWELPREAPASRKRTLEWYHYEGQTKKRKTIPCCNWEENICKECEEEWEFMESISDTLAYKMDPTNISTKYLKTTLAPLLKPAVLNLEHHQDNGGHTSCTTTTVQHLTQSAWPRQSVNENCDKSAKKKESLPAQGGGGVKRGLRGEGGSKSGTTPGKAKRWGRKRNGLFGWITTSAMKTESKSGVNEVENISVEKSTIFKLWGQRLKPDNSS